MLNTRPKNSNEKFPKDFLNTKILSRYLYCNIPSRSLLRISKVIWLIFPRIWEKDFSSRNQYFRKSWIHIYQKKIHWIFTLNKARIFTDIEFWHTIFNQLRISSIFTSAPRSHFFSKSAPREKIGLKTPGVIHYQVNCFKIYLWMNEVHVIFCVQQTKFKTSGRFWQIKRGIQWNTIGADISSKLPMI